MWLYRRGVLQIDVVLRGGYVTVKSEEFIFIQNIWRYIRGVEQSDVVITEEFMLRLSVKNYVLYIIYDVICDVTYKQMSL